MTIFFKLKITEIVYRQYEKTEFISFLRISVYN